VAVAAHKTSELKRPRTPDCPSRAPTITRTHHVIPAQAGIQCLSIEFTGLVKGGGDLPARKQKGV